MTSITASFLVSLSSRGQTITAVTPRTTAKAWIIGTGTACFVCRDPTIGTTSAQARADYRANDGSGWFANAMTSATVNPSLLDERHLSVSGAITGHQSWTGSLGVISLGGSNVLADINVPVPSTMTVHLDFNYEFDGTIPYPGGPYDRSVSVIVQEIPSGTTVGSFILDPGPGSQTGSLALSPGRYTVTAGGGLGYSDSYFGTAVSHQFSGHYAVDLQIAPVGDGMVEVTFDNPPAGGVYRIGPEPSMPEIRAHARVVGVTPDPTSTTTFTWDMNVHYNASQSPHGPHREFNTDLAGIGTTRGSAILVISPSDFDTIRGGDLKLSARATVNGTSMIGEKTGYKILGPTRGSAADIQMRQRLRTILTNSTLRKIASLESGGHQFDNTGYPLWSGDNLGGVGVMQVTNPPPSDDDIWNWQANTLDGKTLFYSDPKMGAVIRLHDRVQRNVNTIVNQARARAKPRPLPPIDVTVPQLTRNPGSSLDQEFNNVTFDDNLGQFEQAVIRVYNGAAGNDIFTPGALHEFQIKRDANNMPILDPDNTAIWVRVPFAQRPPNIGDPNYVFHVLNSADLP